MRKLVLFMLCIVTSIMVHAQKDLNNNQLNLRTGIFNFLKEEGFTISTFHGGLDQRQREDQLYRFSNGSANVLVARAAGPTAWRRGRRPRR